MNARMRDAGCGMRGRIPCALHPASRILFLATLFVACEAFAESQDGVDIDGSVFSGELASVGGDWVVTFRGVARKGPPAEAGSPVGEIQVKELVKWGNPVWARARTMVVLADGGRLVTAADWSGGAAVRLEGEKIIVLCDLFGEVSLPREMVRGIVFAQQRHVADREELAERVMVGEIDTSSTNSAQPRRARSALVMLSNGDRVRGELTSLERGSLTIDTSAGTAKLPLSRVDAVGLDSRPLSVVSRQLKYAVGLRDGSLIYAKNVVADEKQFLVEIDNSVTLTGGDVSDVVFLQLLGGPVDYLSDLEPVDYRHVPYLSLEWPYKRDRNVAGGPLVVDGKRYLGGIGMHSASRVTYRLDGKYKRFDAAVAVDDSAGGRGSVAFGVYLLRDGKLSEAYASGIVRGGDAPEIVSVDIAGAQGLTLTVDYADRGDEMDRADWLDARVVKE